MSSPWPQRYLNTHGPAPAPAASYGRPGRATSRCSSSSATPRAGRAAPAGPPAGPQQRTRLAPRRAGAGRYAAARAGRTARRDSSSTATAADADPRREKAIGLRSVADRGRRGLPEDGPVRSAPGRRGVRSPVPYGVSAAAPRRCQPGASGPEIAGSVGQRPASGARPGRHYGRSLVAKIGLTLFVLNLCDSPWSLDVLPRI
jgi:hypothetical protein